MTFAHAQRRHAAARRPCDGDCGRHVCGHTGVRSSDGKVMCRECRRKASAITVRAATLLCGRCGEWKPDGEFPKATGKKARRGRASLCRPCQTERKREWRWENAAVCVRCGGPRGADSDHSADVHGYRRTGLCQRCYRDRSSWPGDTA